MSRVCALLAAQWVQNALQLAPEGPMMFFREILLLKKPVGRTHSQYRLVPRGA